MSKSWHTTETEETIKQLNAKETGLSQEEAQKRLQQYGSNELRKEKGNSPVRLFLEQFADILIIILLVATGLSIYLGEFVDAIVIIAIVMACAILGFVEEFRSEKALEALKKMTAPTALVLRDGKEVKIWTSEIVPGDIILLYTGDKVPADARLTEAVNLKVDEASLTGESSPVNKDTKPLPESTQLNDMRNMAFTGTVVVYGRGKAVVTSTGMNTQFGKIAKMVQVTAEEETPLEKRMASVGKWVGILSIAVCLTVAGIGVLEGRNILDMILWGISLAVAAVPEALPAIVTGALAVGMYRMAKVNTIVRRLPAVETLGCTSVICSDKTGTMTKGEMTVQRVYTNDKPIKVSGVGYQPEGEFLFEDKKIDPVQEKELTTLLKAAALCNDAKVEKEGDRWVVKGDPTEGALVVAAAKAGLWKGELEKEAPRIGEVPFSSERKCMTTVHMISGRNKTAFTKGAPEIVLAKCTKISIDGKTRKLNEEERTEILKISEAMAIQALRNLGFAFRELPDSTETFDEKIENDLVFVGIVGMIDPPREEVKEAIYLCKKAGIDVVMVTGDHRLTAVAVAKELSLLNENGIEGKALTGEELDKITDEQLSSIVQNVVIYARVSPEHKMRIVKAWKSKGHVVAMTGDGVNDAPALKMSDIGVSMGITGTDVTKEAADMVLTDDNFASIVKAIKEGREIYGNIKKYLTYLLRCNIMEILVMFIVMVGLPYIAGAAYNPDPSQNPKSSPLVALTAIQLLWVNLTTDGLPAIALGVDPGDPNLMEKKPRDPKESVFTRDVKIYLTLVPIMMTSLLLFGYFYYRPWESLAQLTEARTQLLTAMILMELANAVSARSLKYSVFQVGLFKNKFLWLAILSSFGLQLVVLYTPGIQNVFGVTSPEPLDWAFAILFTAIVFGSLELGKYIASKRSA
ncbi:cation-translocating P-type ATPase [Candidatus Bathyarchaeota archaeon]|nr:cation-translocating P-type ATPase [Candidatus Bathyarchaeota archaeon]